jgi:hypothetical protein
MGNRLKNWITLNNGSPLSLFSNPQLVEDIRKTDTTLVLATNAGVKHSNQEATVPGFGKVYYNKEAITNIFGFSDLKKKHQITYDSDKEDASIIYIDNETIKFECSSKGLSIQVSKGLQGEPEANGTWRQQHYYYCERDPKGIYPATI